MARQLTPEQQALRDSKPVGYQYTPDEARFLGYEQDQAGRWRLNGRVESFGGGLPRKGRSTAAAVALGAAAPVGALIGAQFLGAAGGAGGAAGGAASGAGTAAGSTAGAGSAATAAAAGTPWWQRAAQLGTTAAAGMAAGRAEGRQAELDAALRMDAGARNRAQIELEQRVVGEREYDQNTQRALRGALLQGLEDVNIQAPAGVQMGSVTGGLRPSAIGSRDDIGKFLETRARASMANPKPFSPLPDATASVPQGSWFDDALGIVGMASPLTEAFLGRRPQQTVGTPPFVPNSGGGQYSVPYSTVPTTDWFTRPRF